MVGHLSNFNLIYLPLPSSRASTTMGLLYTGLHTCTQGKWELLITPALMLLYFFSQKVQFSTLLDAIITADGSFVTHDKMYFESNSFRPSSTVLIAILSLEQFGDLTVQVTWKSGQSLAICMTFLSEVTVHVSGGQSACKGTHSCICAQQCIPACMAGYNTKNPYRVFLQLQDIVYYFDGLGHLPRVTGGILIWMWDDKGNYPYLLHLDISVETVNGLPTPLKVKVVYKSFLCSSKT